MMENFIRYIKSFQEDRHFSVLAFLVFICPIALSYYLYENYETPKYFFWLCLIGWTAVVYAKYRINNIEKKTLAFFSIWLILGSLSALLSVDYITSVFGFYYRFTSSLLFYVSWALFVIILIKSLSKEKKIFLYQILVFDAFLIAILGLLQSFGILHYEGISSTGLYRAPSFLGNPNFSSMFMAIVLPLAVKFAISADGLRQKIYYISGSFFIIASLLVLASRGSVGAAAISMLFLLSVLVFLRRRKTNWIKVLGVAALIGLVFFSVVSVTRPQGFFKVFKEPDNNIVLRLKLWKTTIKGLERAPFFGEGPGNFQVFFEKTRGSDFANEPGVFDDAHNIFLHMAATTGTPFALMFIIILGYGIFVGIKGKEENLELEWKWAEIASVFAFIIAGSFNPVTIPCFLGLGVVLAGLYSKQAGVGSLIENKQVNIYRTVWLWLGLLLVYFGLALIIAEAFLAFGYRAYLKEDYKKSRIILSIAKMVNPTFFLYDLYSIGSQIRIDGKNAKDGNEIKNYILKHGSGARTYVQGANLYYLLYRQTGNRDYIKKAIEVYHEALYRDPYFGERYGKIAEYYFILADFNMARKYAELSLKLKPGHLPTLVLITKIYQQLGMNNEGLKTLDTAYKLSPLNFQLKVWNYKAKIFKDLNKVGLDVQIYEGGLE